MIILTIISGLTALLTPVVFTIILQNFILFEKLGTTKKEYKANTLIFVLLTIISITFLFPKIFTDKELMGKLVNSNTIDYLLIFPLFILTIWISFSFIEKLKFLTEGKYLNGFRFLGLTYFSFRLFIGSLSGIVPIMGMMLIDDHRIYLASFGYSLGLTIPFLILMLLLANKYEHIRNKKWWKAIQIITLIFIVISLIQKLIAN